MTAVRSNWPIPPNPLCRFENLEEVIVEPKDTLPVVIVNFPDALRAKVGNRKTVTTCGQTVREIIDALEQDHPGLRFHLCYETGDLRSFVNIFLAHQNIRYLQGLDTPVTDGTTLHIMQSVAGG